ncbi:Clp protease N-terminal domain-containing protein [Nocardiopsis mangrovi]|uniref:Clp protease N-terminal domain-containing protein n=1 Tax=Nocardiopsis mangrovi TaxID=1179818 RepID=A0ABV9DUH0_9ACTN
MTNPSAKPGQPAGGFDRTATEIAASREAARTGNIEVGFEHLLLGVLVTGGTGARVLMAAGVGLSEARSAIDILVREDIALLGIDAPLPEPSGTSGAGTPALLPLGPRLRELVDDCPHAGGDRALLAALIDDEGGRVRRLLERLGADTGRIRRELDAPVGTQDATAQSHPSDAPFWAAEEAPAGWEYTVYESQVPVSDARLWQLVSDPERRGEWDTADVSSRQLGDGVVELSHNQNDGETYRESITHSVAGREVTWARYEGKSAAPRSLRIVIEPVGDHARLHLRLGWPNALRGRISKRVVRWVVRQNLRAHSQAIAQAAAS